MPQVINTNVMSLNSRRNLDISGAGLSTALQRLSSGMRINSAKDDAAGLAIANRMTAQIRGLNQAGRNANDGVSLAQTAEGAMGTITNNLQRIRELAIQSANATNSASDRAALQTEVGQLIAEIDRVASTTSFNGVNLLDGTFSSQQFQVGADANQTITVSSIASARTNDLGASYSASVTSGAVTANSIDSGDLIINGVTLGAVGTNDASTLATAINALSGTNVTASANSLTVGGATTGTTAGTGTITINGTTTATITLTTTAATNRANLVAGINAISGATGVTAVDDGTGVDLVSADGSNVVHSFTQATGTFTATTTGMAAAATTRSTVTLSTTASNGITLSTSGTIADTGFSAATTASALSGTSIANTTVATVSGANAAIASADSALNAINSSRASLGALQSRFESVVANLATTAENLSAARSRIQDADFAAETANLTKSQILQQAGISILAQANSQPQLVLSLLQ
ncbi:MAG: flagellin [Proteobacteria bacterium]|nr:flagellin [Pseudomonadota bacterium]NOG58929.1 flagellin [Pseudomonadota bacterium]